MRRQPRELARQLATGIGLTALLATVLAVTISITGTAQSGQSVEWPNITGGYSGTRYSTLDQINAQNFNSLFRQLCSESPSAAAAKGNS